MQIIEGTTEFELNGGSAVSIGKFDGIHLGHQKLLQQILQQKAQGLQAVVFTFDPPPAALFGMAPEKELMTRKEKRRAFDRIGIDVLIEFPLNEQTAAISPEDFIEDLLVKRIHAGFIAAGTDVSFGDRGRGNGMLLHSMARQFGYELQIIDKVCFNGKEVSSTYVREEVEKGHMENAAGLIGSPYGINGIIVYGNRFGRTMGMPTVNLLPPQNKLLPPNGVYFSNVLIRGERHCGITNIGYKPTVSQEGRLGVETYIYDFNKEIYGEEITVQLLSFKRPERKFDGKEALKRTMEKDIEDGMGYHRICR